MLKFLKRKISSKLIFKKLDEVKLGPEYNLWINLVYSGFMVEMIEKCVEFVTEEKDKSE